MELYNSTVAGNEVGIGNAPSSTVINSIIYGNATAWGGVVRFAKVEYSIVQGGSSSIPVQFKNQLDYSSNNISIDPRFISPASGDFRLRDDSAAIGAGGPLPVGIKNLNSPEPVSSAFDLGAFENQRVI